MYWPAHLPLRVSEWANFFFGPFFLCKTYLMFTRGNLGTKNLPLVKCISLNS